MKWVHRDISITNILRVTVGDSAITKMIDVEYAKKWNDEYIHNIRTVSHVPLIATSEANCMLVAGDQ